MHYMGEGKLCWQFIMAWPHSRGQVMSFSKKLEICLTKLKQASKGCCNEEEFSCSISIARQDRKSKSVRECLRKLANEWDTNTGDRRQVVDQSIRFDSIHLCKGRTCKRIQMPAQKPAIGQATKTKRMSQRIAKMGFLDMLCVCCSCEEGFGNNVWVMSAMRMCRCIGISDGSKKYGIVMPLFFEQHMLSSNDLNNLVYRTFIFGMPDWLQNVQKYMELKLKLLHIQNERSVYVRLLD